jgi:hypothetical protein
MKNVEKIRFRKRKCDSRTFKCRGLGGNDHPRGMFSGCAKKARNVPFKNTSVSVQ